MYIYIQTYMRGTNLPFNSRNPPPMGEAPPPSQRVSWSIRSDPMHGRNTCNLVLVGRALTLNPKPGPTDLYTWADGP